ncbi:MAG: glutaminyl-peptide cyclotransferase [Deltaproteobacteria bacterium]|nr:glutaminyl-peptide cyclotransferase [Deltaproteobacteria bacterium]
MAARKKSAKKKSAKSRTSGGSTAKKSASKKAASGKKSAKKRASKKSGGNPGVWLVGVGVVGLGVVAALALGQSDGEAEETQPEVEEVETVEVVDPGAPVVPVAYDVEVVARHPHDDSAFTQGLLWHEGELYESTGLVGRSSIRRWDLSSGQITQRTEVPDVFAEGLERVGDELFQLTWRDGLLLVYDRETFELKRELEYEGEGWGLCFDGEHLVMSDGSHELTFRDPETFAVERRIQVRKVGRPLRMLNELECVDGAIWANVWQRNDIVKIDPATGNVTATVDASGLLTFAERRGADVLNGIAWIPERERFVITGKLWPAAFEIDLVER